jgi:hypothetical protein
MMPKAPSIHPLSTTGAATGSAHSEEPELKRESDVKPDVKPDSKPLNPYAGTDGILPLTSISFRMLI